MKCSDKVFNNRIRINRHEILSVILKRGILWIEKNRDMQVKIIKRGIL